jgi:hypothetical protein
MDIVYTDKCRYDTHQEKKVPVWHTDIYRPISNTDCIIIFANRIESTTLIIFI